MQMNCHKSTVVTYHLTQEMCLIIEFASLANPSNIYIYAYQCIHNYICMYTCICILYVNVYTAYIYFRHIIYTFEQ